MITITQFKEENIDLLASWVSNEKEVMLWAGPGYGFETLKQDILERLIDSKKNADKVKMFSAYNAETDKIVGHVQLFIDAQNDSGYIGRMIVAPEFRGKGYCSAIINEILKLGFNELKLNMINLIVFDFNTSAIKCYEKCGFIKEGILRDRRKIDNEYWSLVSMSIKNDEYNGSENK
jgi:RimJ/RimL family protein N-acetyltransferase